MKKLLIASLLFICLAIFARDTFRGKSGQITGSSTTHGNRTTYRDSSGRISGSATTYGNRTTYRDSSGRITGT
ncbi:MAG: hypothetical protein J6W67_09345, partial [Lentisphaeria bacterium]|nr:hypothetical protein [Lentisphaeria bacterium]